MGTGEFYESYSNVSVTIIVNGIDIISNNLQNCT